MSDKGRCQVFWVARKVKGRHVMEAEAEARAVIEAMTEADDAVLAAITTVQKHLDTEWISEGCFEHQAFGCASCRAVVLRKELTLLADYLIEDAAAALASPPTPEDAGER